MMCHGECGFLRGPEWETAKMCPRVFVGTDRPHLSLEIPGLLARRESSPGVSETKDKLSPVIKEPGLKRERASKPVPRSKSSFPLPPCSPGTQRGCSEGHTRKCTRGGRT